MMKKRFPGRGFNLIEITMAIAIVGIGIAGIMALFPPAIEANKNANFQNFTGTVVNNVAAYLDYKLKRDWDFRNSLKLKADATTPNAEPDISGWTEIANFNGIFKTLQNQEDLLGIRSQDSSIAAHVRIWKDTNADHLMPGYYDAAAHSADLNAAKIPISSDYRIRVVIELSWPVAKAYDDREKQEFVYEFNKPEN